MLTIHKNSQEYCIWELDSCVWYIPLFWQDALAVKWEQ